MLQIWVERRSNPMELQKHCPQFEQVVDPLLHVCMYIYICVYIFPHSIFLQSNLYSSSLTVKNRKIGKVVSFFQFHLLDIIFFRFPLHINRLYLSTQRNLKSQKNKRSNVLSRVKQPWHSTVKDMLLILLKWREKWHKENEDFNVIIVGKTFLSCCGPAVWQALGCKLMLKGFNVKILFKYKLQSCV